MALSIFEDFDQKSEGIVPEKEERLLRDLQGNILKAHGRSFAVYLFIAFAEAPDSVKSWISDFGKTATTAWKQHEDSLARESDEDHDGGIFRSLLLSAAGYEYLDFSVRKFEEAFRDGMKRRDSFVVNALASVADIENKDPKPARWQIEYQAEYHAAVLLASDNEDELKEAVSDLRKSLDPIAMVHEEWGNRLTWGNDPKGKDIEHFGYRDGISNPLFFRKDIKEKPHTEFDVSAPLHLVLARDPYGTTAGAQGSYFVFRKLEQDVAGFNQEVARLAARVNDGDADLAGAQVVGRFKDGTPVTLHKSPVGIDTGDKNDFSYEKDSGSRCPLHAHTRKTNPRENNLVNRERSRRIVRRGIPYGKDAEKEKVGLLFGCYQADISHQFEFIQRIWIDNPRFPEIGIFKKKTGDDPLVGQDNSEDALQRWPVTYDDGSEEEDFNFRGFVTLRGGEYFFAPSVGFLKEIGA